MTDSQLITHLVAVKYGEGLSLKDALKSIVEEKLLGTYRIAALEVDKPQSIIFIKNSGEFSLCVSKNEDEVIISSESSLFNQQDIKHKFSHKISIPNNTILEVNQNCEYTFTKIEKKIKIQRNPKAMFDHIMHEEIVESIDAVDMATDFGGKFISDH
jgi:glucosamine 6-phosphate synthetase-like amidotransferase/phosphosugar isomerase protein